MTEECLDSSRDEVVAAFPYVARFAKSGPRAWHRRMVEMYEAFERVGSERDFRNLTAAFGIGDIVLSGAELARLRGILRDAMWVAYYRL